MSVGGYHGIGRVFTFLEAQSITNPLGVFTVDDSLIVTGILSNRTHNFEASDFLNSTDDGWAVTALAPTSSDPSLAMVNIRAFDADITEGVGFQFHIPLGATSFMLVLTWRKSSDNAGNVRWYLYTRKVGQGALIGADAWTSQLIADETNASSQVVVQTTATITIASTGLLADELAYFQLVRQMDGNDTYTDDAYVLNLSISTV